LSEAFHHWRESLEQNAQALEQRDLELNSIRDLTEVLDRVQSMEEFLRRLLLEKSMDATNARIGSVFLHDPAAGRLRMIAARGLDHVEESYSVAIDDSLMKAVVSERKPLVVRNIEEDPRTLKPNAPRYGAPSFMSMPIHMGDELIGILNLSHKEKGRPSTPWTRGSQPIICDEIALALERVHLRTSLDLHKKRLKEQDYAWSGSAPSAGRRRKQWKRYKFIVDVSRRFLTLINRDYVYEAASDAFCGAHCLTPEDVVGRSVSDIWGEKDFNGIIRTYLDRCLSGEEVTYEDSFEFPALGLQHFAVSYWPYRNDEGIVTHAMVFTQNITERKKLEGQLNQAQKLKALGTLAGGIAHDFNNLLMAIQGYTSLTLIGMDSSNPDYEKLKAVEKQVLAGVNLTRQLLDSPGRKIRGPTARHERGPGSDRHHVRPDEEANPDLQEFSGGTLVRRGGPQSDRTGPPEPLPERLAGHAGGREILIETANIGSRKRIRVPPT
jgi:PAS domain S-box-containing protein